MAKKYIDADKLLAEIDNWKEAMADAVGEYSDGVRFALEHFTFVLDSLQQEQPDEVLIPRWCLENIENTLRIQHNINNDAKDGETCQDRNVKESLNCVRKLLNGEEITGLERLEPLTKQPEVDLKEASRNVYESWMGGTMNDVRRDMVELGKVLNARKEENK